MAVDMYTPGCEAANASVAQSPEHDSCIVVPSTPTDDSNRAKTNKGCMVEFSTSSAVSLQGNASLAKEKAMTFTCPYPMCGKVSTKRRDHRRHMSAVHNEGVVWFCCRVKGCGFHAKRRDYFQRHNKQSGHSHPPLIMEEAHFNSMLKSLFNDVRYSLKCKQDDRQWVNSCGWTQLCTRTYDDVSRFVPCLESANSKRSSVIRGKECMSNACTNLNVQNLNGTRASGSSGSQTAASMQRTASVHSYKMMGMDAHVKNMRAYSSKRSNVGDYRPNNCSHDCHEDFRRRSYSGPSCSSKTMEYVMNNQHETPPRPQTPECLSYGRRRPSIDYMSEDSLSRNEWFAPSSWSDSNLIIRDYANAHGAVPAMREEGKKWAGGPSPYTGGAVLEPSWPSHRY